MTCLMTCSITSSRIFFCDTSGSCWVEMTTVCTRTGLRPWYSIVTCDFASGRRYGISFGCFLRMSARRFTSLCANMIGIGMYSGVSFDAYPNIIPWSPAPPVSTPRAISGDCEWIAEMTEQDSASKRYSAFV